MFCVLLLLAAVVNFPYYDLRKSRKYHIGKDLIPIITVGIIALEFKIALFGKDHNMLLWKNIFGFLPSQADCFHFFFDLFLTHLMEWFNRN